MSFRPFFPLPFGIKRSLTIDSSNFDDSNKYIGWVLCRFDDNTKIYYLHPLLGNIGPLNNWINVDFCVVDTNRQIFLNESEIESITRQLDPTSSKSKFINTKTNESFDVLLTNKSLGIHQPLSDLSDYIKDFQDKDQYKKFTRYNYSSRLRIMSHDVHLEIIEPVFIKSDNIDMDDTIFKGRTLIMKVENQDKVSIYFARPIFEVDETKNKTDQNSYYKLKYFYKNINVKNIMDIPIIRSDYHNYFIFEEPDIYYIPKKESSFIPTSSMLDNRYFQCKGDQSIPLSRSEGYLYTDKPKVEHTEYQPPHMFFPKNKKPKKHLVKASVNNTGIENKSPYERTIAPIRQIPLQYIGGGMSRPQQQPSPTCEELPTPTVKINIRDQHIMDRMSIEPWKGRVPVGRCRAQKVMTPTNIPQSDVINLSETTTTTTISEPVSNSMKGDVNTLPETTTTTTTTSKPVSKNTNVTLSDIKVPVSSPCSVGIVEIRFNDEIAKFHLINNKLPVSSICSRFNLRYFCIDGVVVSNDYYGLSHLDFNDAPKLNITC
jgi:hypothetical protein